MSDISDLASEYEEAHNSSSLKAARLLNLPEQVQNPDGSWPTIDCIDCDEEIEKPRLALGKIRCILCQRIFENKGRGIFRL